MRGVAQMLVESQVLFAKQFRSIHDLARMQREVLYYVINRFEDGFIVPLHSNALREPLRRNILNHLDGFINRFRSLERSPAPYFARAPNSVSRSRVSGSATDGRYDPLPYVSAQMENQVSDRVTCIRAAPPDLFLGQPFQTVLDALLRLP